MAPFVRVRLTARLCALFCLIGLCSLAGSAHAQTAQVASFINGSGNWSDSNNWSCRCVPNGTNFTISLGNAAVTLDLSASVYTLDGTGSLTIDSQTLTANSNGIGIFELGTLQVSNGVINSAPGATAGTLIATGSTLPGMAVLNSATISSSTLQSLGSTGQLNISNSTIGASSSMGVSTLSLTAPSQITTSTVDASLQVMQGGSLLVDQGTTVNVPTNSSAVNIFGGAMTLQGASVLNVNFGPLSMSTPGSLSSLTLDGAGTAINLADNSAISLLGLGDATLTVQNNAAINGGSTTNFLVGSPLPLGPGGYSHVVISTGSKVATGETQITGSLGTASSVQVTDPNSQLTITNALIVSGGGLAIQNEGQVTADLMDIGSADVADIGQVLVETGGKLTLDGSSHSENLLVGSTGRGTLTIQGGGTGSGIQSLVLGNDAGAYGTMTITGSGQVGAGVQSSSWENSGTLYVGYVGNGTLNVTNLGELLTDGAQAGNLAAVIGTQQGSIGSATVNAGTWTLGGTLSVGEFGNGTLTIASDLSGGVNGPSLVRGRNAVIGNQSGSTGTVTVSGNGALWDNAGDLTVGNSGKATLSILNGGVVNDVNAIIAAAEGSSSSFAADASVSVDGLGSQWNNSGRLIVGQEGNASLTISAGGMVIDTDAQVGYLGGNGTVNVSDTGSQWRSATLTVGSGGTGNVTVTNQALIAADSVVLGSGGTGSFQVTNGGALRVTGALNIDGGGTLAIEGGKVESGSGQVGVSSGQGVVSMSGGSWTIGGGGGTLNVGTTASGAGAVTVTGGGIISANQVVVNPTGILTVQGGVIDGNVVNAGGTITPGDAVGIMTVNGNYIQDVGTLLLEIDGSGLNQFDQLLISGMAQFNGGTIEILFGNGFSPTNGENFDLIAANLGLVDNGVAINVQGLPSGFQFTDSFSANGFAMTFDQVSPPTGTPEPGSMAMLIAGFIGTVVVRFRTNRKIRTEP
jgi:T5SS/PEP-CTERM-associated repeat protein